jgi:cytoskeletal protein RodZ
MDLRDDRRIDEAIDRAVREMMSADPPAEMRARVLARLEGRGGPGGWPIVRLAAAAGMIAAAVLIVVLGWRVSDQPEPDLARSTAASEPTVAAPPPAPPAPPDSSSLPPAPAERADPEQRRPAATVRTATERTPVRAGRPDRLNQEIAAASVAVGVETGPSAIDAIPDIDVGRIATAPIEMLPVSVSPLSPLRQLQIEPLEPTGGHK